VTELLLRPLADAFMQVGVFVALLVAPFGWARWRWGDRFDSLLRRNQGLGPLVAAAVTMPPGCGGAIIVMAVYARGGVTFGAAVAALVATMGDASWVLLAADPVLTLQLKGLLLVTGTICGYAVDALGITPRLGHDTDPPATAPAPVPLPVLTSQMVAARGPATSRLAALGVLPVAIWLCLGVGATISVPVTFQLSQPADLYLMLGVAGTAVALFAFLQGGGRLADDDARTARPESLNAVLRHGAHEVSFVTVWIAAAYLAWSLLTHLTGFDGSQLPLLGVAGVLVGALIGLVPGCAMQIVFTGIFLAGGMPLSTLAANMVSQDGDALLPLLALEHRSALIATVLTTIPALIVGTGFLVLG